MRKRKQVAFAHNSCPAGHGAMYWMIAQEKYFCSHQAHDMDGSKQWWTSEELAIKHEQMKEDKR